MGSEVELRQGVDVLAIEMSPPYIVTGDLGWGFSDLVKQREVKDRDATL